MAGRYSSASKFESPAARRDDMPLRHEFMPTSSAVIDDGTPVELVYPTDPGTDDQQRPFVKIKAWLRMMHYLLT